MIIMAVDPGDTSGIAVCSVAEHMSTFTILYHEDISLWRGVEAVIDIYHPDVIVVEQYKLYPHLAAAQSFSTMVASRVLGAVEEIAERRGILLIEQSASVGTKIRLPEHIFRQTGKYWTEHTKDCVKHITAYCYGRGIKE